MTANKYNQQSTSFPQEVPHAERRTFELLVSQLQQMRNQIERNRGRMLVEAFNAAQFTASGAQTWTVIGSQVTRNTYARVDDLLFWSLTIAASAVGGTPAISLIVKLPGGFRCARGAPDTPGDPAGAQTFIGNAVDNGGTREACVVTATPGSDRVSISLLDGSNWANSASGTAVSFSCCLDVE